MQNTTSATDKMFKKLTKMESYIDYSDYQTIHEINGYDFETKQEISFVLKIVENVETLFVINEDKNEYYKATPKKMETGRYYNEVNGATAEVIILDFSEAEYYLIMQIVGSDCLKIVRGGTAKTFMSGFKQSEYSVKI